MTVEHVRRAAAPTLVAGTERSVPAAGAPDLLPAAAAPSLGQLQGGMADLYAMLVQLRDAQVGQSKAQVDETTLRRNEAERQRAEAVKRAREAAEEGGLFDWLSEDIGLAGVVGLVTFNYALVAADISAHKLDVVDNVKIDVIDVGAVATGRYDVLAADILLRKTDIAPKEARELLEKCGIPKDAPGISDEDVEPIAKKLLMANLMIASVAATVLSGGATTAGLCIALAGVAASAAGSQIAEHDALDGIFGKGSSKWIGLGMQIGGAITAGVSGVAAHGAALGSAAKTGGTVANGAVQVARGTDQMVVAVNENARDKANIAAEAAKLKLARLERLIEFLIDGIKEVTKSSQNACESLQGAISTADQTQVALAQGTRV